MRLFRFVKSSVLWLSILISCLSINLFSTNGTFGGVIRSDGQGYYAYLPAVLIYNDPTYELSTQAEKKYIGKDFNQLYLYKDDQGNILNKYFPGVAVLQLPFFGLACLHSWVLDQSIDGYSSIFQFWFLLGALFYMVLGLILFKRFLDLLFPLQKKLITRVFPLLIFATPLLFYLSIPVSFGHLYSFFLFGLFAHISLSIKKKITIKNMIFLGLVLGLITLVRPTNILVIILLPILLGSPKALGKFLQKIFSKTPVCFFVSSISFISVISVIFLLWKWQSGNWFVWSYNGEGFNFLQPRLIENLFSFRVGLFLHTPFLILSFIGSVFLFRQNKFQGTLLWVYFILNAWIISSWWCWDYESSFGNRPFTEHLVFLVPPVFLLVNSYKKLILFFSILFAFVGLIRYFEFYSGFMFQQRFTSDNYFSSLNFWEKENYSRWQFTQACPPHGEIVEEAVLFEKIEETNVSSDNEFLFGISKELKKPRVNERFYYRVELDKKIQSPDVNGVFLVVDGTSIDHTDYRAYISTELYNDRFEGKNEWKHLVFEGQMLDNFQYLDKVSMFIYNQSKKSFFLKNVKFTLYTYDNSIE